MQKLKNVKKFEVGQLRFEVLVNSENTIYMLYIYALRGYSGYEVAQLQKNNFSENSLMYMLYIWHGGCFMKRTQK
jgi:hypothetical protein